MGVGRAFPRIWLAIPCVNRLHGELVAGVDPDPVDDIEGDGVADPAVELTTGTDEAAWTWREVVKESDANVELAGCADDPHDARGRAAIEQISA